MIRDDPKARRAIEGLLGHLSPPAVSVDRWPDLEERNRPEIDAVAGRYAIEHTRLDSFPGQTEDTEFFSRLAALQATLALDYRLTISLPVGALSPGTNWDEILARVEQWITGEAHALPVGEHSIAVDGVPFAMEVRRGDATWAPGLRIGRQDPGDFGFAEVLRHLAARKINKLRPHRAAGAVAILLIETRCEPLMSPKMMRDGLQEAFPDGLPAGVDQVWFADWSCEELPTYCRLR